MSKSFDDLPGRACDLLTHELLWHALTLLAHRNNLSRSGLAKLAGLDATAFNPSKRVRADGRLRWPGTETLARVLRVTETSLPEFVLLLEEVRLLTATQQVARENLEPMFGRLEDG